jgi:hypothetical protein
MTLPARNFKFLTEGSLERTGNYRLCEKGGRVENCLGVGPFPFHVLRSRFLTEIGSAQSAGWTPRRPADERPEAGRAVGSPFRRRLRSHLQVHPGELDDSNTFKASMKSNLQSQKCPRQERSLFRLVGVCQQTKSFYCF